MIDSEQLKQYVYDPNKIQRDILGYIKDSNNGTLDIVDPTNPFTMLLEATAINSSNPLLEMKANMRKIHASLAETKDDQYHHLTDEVIVNMFGVPATADIVFYINMNDITRYGVRNDTAGYNKTTIPEYTEVTVAGTNFTLMNDIDVRLYDNGSVFVEQQSSTSDIAINDLGILNAVVTSDAENNSWILFETTLKQITRKVFTDTILAASGYDKKVLLEKQYYYTEFSYKNSYTDNQYVKLPLIHDDAYINPNTPSVYVSQGEQSISYKIPDVYMVDGNVSGNVNIVLYETNGEMYLPLNNYKLTDFKIVLGNSGKNVSTSTSTNITMLANSRHVVDGGKNTLSSNEIKDAIINNTSGDINLPITDNALKRKSSFNGFDVFKATDIITNRVFIAAKNTPVIDSDIIYSRADIFTNTVKVVIGEYLNNSKFYTDNDIFIIKSGNLFKNDNGVLNMLSDAERNNVNNMGNNEKAVYLKNNKLFYTPFYYIVDKTNSRVNSRAYDLDNPKINNLKLLGKNINVLPRFNTTGYIITKTSTGYRIKIELVGNQEFDNLTKSNIRAQIKFPITDSQEFVYYEGSYINGFLYFDIESNGYINNNNNLLITGGTTALSETYIDLNVNAIIHMYIVDSSMSDSTGYLKNELVISTGDYVTVFSKESIDINFGTELKYLWRKVRNEHNERMYLKYTDDIPMVYTKDIYTKDPNTGTMEFVVNNGNVEYTIEHAEGDPVLDTDGNQVYVHKKGDVILDVNGLPTIDQVNGVVRYIDVLMLEYEYTTASSLPYVNYYQMIMDTVLEWLTSQLTDINNDTLENTEILFKSYKSITPVKLTINNTIYSTNYITSPYVTLYTNTDNYSSDELATMKHIIGGIIHEAIDGSYVSMADIKNSIINRFGSNIVGVKIAGLDSVGDLEAFNIYDKTSRLSINKTLEVDSNNETVVTYDLKLVINKI